MDYQGEQEMELEALEAILMDDFQEIKDNIPSGWSAPGAVYRVILCPMLDDEEGEADIPVKAELVFAHTSTYPETGPLLKARGLQALSDADVANLQARLDIEVEENLGMAMIYSLVSVAQEWVNEKALQNATPSMDPALAIRRELEAEEARRAELRAHGTAVTPEAFAAWQRAFQAEHARSAGAPGAALAERGAEGTPLSGKKFFKLQEAKHVVVEEEPSGSDEEGWDAPLEDALRRDGEKEEELDDDSVDYDEDSSDDEGLLQELAASRGA